MSPGSRKCPSCDVTIGADEKKCPACGVDVELLEQEITVVDRANKVLEKRKAATQPPTPTPTPTPTPKKRRSVFDSLGDE